MAPRLLLHAKNPLSPRPVEPGKMKRQGEAYVLSTGQVFTKSQITADYIYNLKKKNTYFKGVLLKQKALIFRKKVSIEVVDKNGERDDRVTKKVQKRFLSKGYNIWNAMRQAFDDTFSYGISVWNPVTEWRQTPDGLEYTPVELRHLPCRTFAGNVYQAPTAQSYNKVYQNSYRSEMFNGILFNIETMEMEYWQTFDMEIKQLTNVFSIKDPASEDFAGEPMALPIIPIVQMLKYVWKSQMQTVNRIGAPLAFIKIAAPKDADGTNGQLSDIEYASALLKNWGKDTIFLLRDNMTFEAPSITEGTVNSSIIEDLNRLIVDYFSPASSISNNGTLISGSSDPELDLLNAYINGIHDWLEAAFQPLVQEWLDVNRYDGYTAVIEIPEPEADQTTTNIQKALAGHSIQALDTNEKRLLLGEEELDTEGLQKLKEEYSQPAAPQGNPFSQFSYQPGELKQIQGGGLTATANTFLADGLAGSIERLDLTNYGTDKSGNRGHEGIPGHRGGSAKGRGKKVRIKDPAKVKQGAANTNRITPAQHAIAMKSEHTLTKAISGKKQPDMSAFDVIKGKYAIEVKTLIVANNDKITMAKPKRLRKIKYAKDNGLKPYTVVFDQRDGRIFVKQGVGSFRTSAMQEVKMKDLVRMFK